MSERCPPAAALQYTAVDRSSAAAQDGGSALPRSDKPTSSRGAPSQSDPAGLTGARRIKGGGRRRPTRPMMMTTVHLRRAHRATTTTPDMGQIGRRVRSQNPLTTKMIAAKREGQEGLPALTVRARAAGDAGGGEVNPEEQRVKSCPDALPEGTRLIRLRYQPNSPPWRSFPNGRPTWSGRCAAQRILSMMPLCENGLWKP